MNSKKRHVPLRSCIACRSKTAKRELLRIVAQPNGGIAFDPGGKLSGRGAYLCQTCADNSEGIGRGRLEHTLRTSIADVQWQELAIALKEYVNAPVN